MFDFRGHFRETIESFQEEAASEGKTPLSAECIDLITQCAIFMTPNIFIL